MIEWIRSLFESREFGAARSSRWATVRSGFLRAYPLCVVCDSEGTLLNAVEVHHVLPFHTHPERELDASNLITLCRVHHFWLGHLGAWTSYNSGVREDAASWHSKILNRP